MLTVLLAFVSTPALAHDTGGGYDMTIPKELERLPGNGTASGCEGRPLIHDEFLDLLDTKQ